MLYEVIDQKTARQPRISVRAFMRAWRAFGRSLLPAVRGVALAGLIGVLSACSAASLSPFGEATDYKLSVQPPIQALSGDSSDHHVKDEALQGALDTVLEDRLAEPIHTEESAEENARRESYREDMIRADLEKALRSKGYYEGDVRYRDDPSRSLAGEYDIVAGALYTIAAMTVEPSDFADMLGEDVLGAAQIGAALDAQAVLDAQARLAQTLQKEACYFTLEVNHKVVLDTQEKTAAVTFTVNAGTEAVFGATVFEGMESVDPAYLNRMVKWKEGDCFGRDKIASLRDRLLSSGLFVSAEVELPETLDAPELVQGATDEVVAQDTDGGIPGGRDVALQPVPVTIVVKERAHRSLSAGIGYYTDEGGGVTLGWEHRNILGQAEKLSAELNVSQLKQSLSANFTKPAFLREDQSLLASASAQAQDTDAYNETGVKTSVAVKRTFGKHWSGSLGGALSLSEIEENNDTQTYALVSSPVTLGFDNRDDALDPRKGIKAEAAITPFFDGLGHGDPFTKAQVSGATYVGFGEEKDTVLAVRGLWGSIIGSGTFDIPATERFFAGGGGSVRGYGYQDVGPKDAAGDPTGGRSVVTGGAELRVKATDTFGVVGFADVGTVSDTSYPDFEQLSVGAGAGIRYYTDFGPLRFDVATPLTQKEETDSSYQLYISIGQAF